MCGQTPWIDSVGNSEAFLICLAISEAVGPPTNVPRDAPAPLRSFLLDGCFSRDPSRRSSAAQLLEHPYMTCADSEIDPSNQSLAAASFANVSCAESVFLPPALMGGGGAAPERRGREAEGSPGDWASAPTVRLEQTQRGARNDYKGLFADLDAVGAMSTSDAGVRDVLFPRADTEAQIARSEPSSAATNPPQG
eukprot:gene2536-1791_t